VMCGGMFAGTDESKGQTVERDGKMYKQFYGMSSSTAMVRTCASQHYSRKCSEYACRSLSFCHVLSIMLKCPPT